MQIRALTTTGLCLGLMWGLLATTTQGQMPSMQGYPPMVSQTSFMVPENMPPGVSQAMYAPTGQMPPGAVAQVGFCSPLGGGSCDSACDGYCGCSDGGGCCGGGGCGCTGCGPGGLLGQICQGGSLNGLQNLCMFCRGSGCSVCQAPSNAANMLGCLGMLAPYTEAGLCAQRWYDFQAEAIFLTMNGSSANQALTSSGVGASNILMSTNDAESDNLSAGFRLTASMMFGAGGNLEATYFGTNHFSHNQEVVDPTNSLYSAYSDFGISPPGGYNETDQSAVHSLRYSSEIHSGEANYRRRWVGPYCRFQGSWLLGFRYFDLDESLTFATRNELNFSTATSEFLDSTTQTRNALVGAQLGGDLWWNVHPGINLGVGWKGAIFGNRAEQDTHLFYSGETLVGGVPTRTLLSRDEQAADSTTALMSELQVRMAYRLSYSWTFTAAYWFIGIDGVALGAGNVNTSQANRLFNTNTARDVSINIDDSLTMQGFSVGLEYLW